MSKQNKCGVDEFKLKELVPNPFSMREYKVGTHHNVKKTTDMFLNKWVWWQSDNMLHNNMYRRIFLC